MKPIIAGLLLLMATNSGWAQLQLKPRFTLKEIDTSFLRNHPSITNNQFIQNNRRLLQNPPTQFSYTVIDGTVFTLPQDNMPWLRPDTSICLQHAHKNECR